MTDADMLSLPEARDNCHAGNYIRRPTSRLTSSLGSVLNRVSSDKMSETVGTLERESCFMRGTSRPYAPQTEKERVPWKESYTEAYLVSLPIYALSCTER